MAEELHFDDPAAAAQDPSTDAEALRQLAYRYPELRPVVAAHPHAYRGLLDWLHQFNDPQVNAALEARDDYDGYIDSNGYLVMHGDVSGAVAGSSIRTSESGIYVLGQGGVNSYSQVERTTPYSAVVGTNAPVPQVGARPELRCVDALGDDRGEAQVYRLQLLGRSDLHARGAARSRRRDGTPVLHVSAGADWRQELHFHHDGAASAAALRFGPRSAGSHNAV